MKHNYIKNITNIFSVLLIILFFVVVYSHVFSSQLSTGDDALISVAARNLAEGNGYSLSAPYDTGYGISQFSPGITTGPTLVVPAALVIKIFGNTLWAPGFVTATFCLILLVFIIKYINKKFNLTMALLFSIVLIYFFYNITAQLHFIHWYVILGELPASFLNILAIIIIAIFPNSRKSLIIAGFLFGLAFMTKMLSLLGFLPLLGWFLINLIKEKQNRKHLLVNYLFSVLAFAIPFLFFEIWKLISMGFAGYYENWNSFLQLFGHLSGAKEETSISFVDKFILRNGVFSEHFGFSIYLLLIVAAITTTVVYYFSDKKFVRLLFSLLMFGALLHLFYWIFFSIGWIRYVLIGLFLYFAALSSLFLIKFPKNLISISLLFIIFISPIARLKNPINHFEKFGFHYDNRLVNLQRTVSFLKNYNHDRPFIAAWWASVADVEYAMPELQNFKKFDYLKKEDYGRDLILVSNTKFTDERFHLDKFDKWKKKFKKVLLDAPPYLVSVFKFEVKTLKDNRIDFSLQGNANDYITYGWSIKEQSHIWTNEPSAGLMFNLPKPLNDTLIIKLLGFGYLAKGKIKDQGVSVFVNSHFVTHWQVVNQNWYIAKVSPELLNNNTKVRVEFKIENATSPSSFGYSNDTRMLGIGVKEIIVDFLTPQDNE